MSNKRKIITNSFIKLISEKSIVQITVEQIIQEANVSKSTFYRSFHDKYDLMNYLFKEQSELVYKNNPHLDNWRERTIDLLLYYKENAKIYKNIVKYEGQNSHFDFLYELSYEDLYNHIYVLIGKKNLSPELIFALKVHSNTCAYAITEWIKNDCNYAAAELVSLIELCLPCNLKPYF